MASIGIKSRALSIIDLGVAPGFFGNPQLKPVEPGIDLIYKVIIGSQANLFIHASHVFDSGVHINLRCTHLIPLFVDECERNP